MTTLNDYLTAGRKALKQWAPVLDDAISRTALTSAAEEDRPASTTKTTGAADFQPPSLSEILKSETSLPDHAVLLGVGDDRLPYHLDLTNPSSGAVLICGDADSNTTALMRSILASATALNSAQQLHLSVIARHADDYMDFTGANHCQEILPADDETVSEFVTELADLVEERRNAGVLTPSNLLLIDDLPECLDYLSEAAYARLYRLIRHGPRYRVWTFATLPTDRAAAVGDRFLSAFRTRLIGHIRDQRQAAELSQDARMRAGRLGSDQFYLPFGSQWIRFWTCSPDLASDAE